MSQWRFILAVVLSMGVFFVYYTWIAPPPKPPQPSQRVTQTTDALVTGDEISKKENGAPLPSVLNHRMRAPAEAERRVTLENDDVVAELSSYGALVKSWVLKKFHVETHKESPLIDLLNGQGEGEGLFLTVGFSEHDENPSYKLIEDEKSAAHRRILFVWESEALRIEKEYLLAEETSPYVLDVSVKFINKTDQILALNPSLSVAKKQKAIESKGGFLSLLKGPPNLVLPVYHGEGKTKYEHDWKKLKSENEYSGRVYWTGLSDRYFLLGLVSRVGSDSIKTVYGRHDDTVYASLSYGGLSLHPSEAISQKFSAFLGPKRREDLSQLQVQLEKSVDYGWFSFVAIPLLWFLIFLYKMVGNWGIAIILLTFFVKLLLHPINKKSMESMRAMQKLQPKFAELREKHANNREKLNMEMMLLFKTHKVNPMSGCLPMVVQMPVYFALYKVLWNAVELYHAPFFWIYRDLSEPDPFYVTPILLGIMLALQQKLTPQTTMDPAQRKMMMIMPLMFSGFMIFLPFGLVLYILVNTIMSVVQQYMMHREMSLMDLIHRMIPSSKKA